MERIKKALESARQERKIRQGHAPLPATGSARTEFGTKGDKQTRTISVEHDILRGNRIVTGIEPGPFTHAYNLLRTQILQRFRENNWNVLAVTSPGEGEGKTLTAINLAISIAREVDYTVLLIDANLHNPRMLEHFDLEPCQGLSEHLTDNIPLPELLIQSEQVEHLVILPGGKPLANSAEMLNSPKMKQLIEDIKSRYHSRIIIFDLPPVLSTADALAFSPYVDAALLVVEEGVTQKQDVERAVDLLSSTNIVGTVLNKAERDS